MTLKEYLTDYASEKTREVGLPVIAREIQKVPNEKIRQRAIDFLAEIDHGKRDFRF